MGRQAFLWLSTSLFGPVGPERFFAKSLRAMVFLGMPRSFKPRTPPQITDAIRDRFWSKVNKSASCWLWSAALDDKGYGHFKLGGAMWKAPRVSWLLSHGDPAHLCVCHRCDDRRCVNPAHLFVATHEANIEDAIQKGRLTGEPIEFHAFRMSRRGHPIDYIPPKNAYRKRKALPTTTA